MSIQIVLIIFFAAILIPVLITLVYCSFRGCGGTAEDKRDDDLATGPDGEMEYSLDQEQDLEQDIWQPDPRD